MKLGLPMHEVQVQSLVRELRSQGNIKQKQYCNKFSQDIKMVHIKNKKTKKKSLKKENKQTKKPTIGQLDENTSITTKKKTFLASTLNCIRISGVGVQGYNKP